MAQLESESIRVVQNKMCKGLLMLASVKDNEVKGGLKEELGDMGVK